jgi:pyruvate formate lyase activating enzyme
MPDTGIKIAGWNKLSFIDFPGTIAAVLFLAGCNMRCPYCHNPGVVRGEYPLVDLSAVKKYLEKRRDMVEGVVLSGGEPCIHEELPETANELCALGLKIKLDTNGLLPAMISACNPDYLALDIKTIPARYGELGCGYDDAESRLMRSIDIVKAMREEAEIRITVVPPFVDDHVIAEVKKMVAGVAKVFLQPFKNDPPLLDPAFSKKGPYAIEKILEFRKSLAPVVGECVIRGQ